LVPVYLIVGSFLLPFYNLGICRAVFQLCCSDSVIASAKHSNLEVYLFFSEAANAVSADGLKHSQTDTLARQANASLHSNTKYQDRNTRHTSFSTVSSNKPKKPKIHFFLPRINSANM